MNTSIPLLTFCVGILLFFCRYVCGSFDIPGETSPASVEIEIGESVNISCRMNPKVFQDRTARDLYFINAITHERVEETDIVIINDTTIMYMLQNVKESKRTYRCMCGNNAIMETTVYVGHKPEPITDFICSSYNYENMKCNFTKPDNHVLTQYNVSYHFDLKAYKYSPICDHERSPLVSCTAIHANEYIYHYEIVATNSLGTLTQYFDVDNMSVMVLAAPGQNFSLRHVTAESATFTFRLKNPSRSLQWEVLVEPRNLSAILLSPYVHPVPISSNEFQLSLTNLSYAYYEYKIVLRVRLSAINRWSEPFQYWFRTLSRLPDRPPRIDVGSFETHPSENKIRLYWELLEPFEYNGYNFTYLVEQIGASQFEEPFLLESNSAVFLWNKEYQYEFAIRSKNHLGMSKLFTRIKIPAMVPESKREMHTPPEVHTMNHEHNETSTLNWSPPKSVEGLVDYTVYWCRKRSHHSNGCEGSIHFQRVPRDILNFTTAPQEHPLSLAVSANYENFNTGMHWTECTVRETTDLVIMKPNVNATSASTIKVEWGSEYVCPSIFDGYNLSYCEIDVDNHEKTDIDSYNCTENDVLHPHFVLINKTFKKWEIQKLKPYTHYQIQINMYSQRKVGKKSSPQIVQTGEAAPTSPLQLKVLNKANTSATISWLPPRESNGLIRFYYIVVKNNNKNMKTPAITNDTFGRFIYKLENLSSSTPYNVHVLAETVPNSISPPSNEVNFTTFVGYPTMPGPITLHDRKNDAEIEWITPSGRVDFYEVSVTLMKGDEVLGKRISIVIGANSCTFRIPKCFDHEYRTTVEVRSVNAASLAFEVDTHSDGGNNVIDENDERRFYEDNDELICQIKSKVDDKPVSPSFLKRQKFMVDRYTNNSVYRLYKSNWHRGPIFSCAASTLGLISLYIILATLFAGFLVMVIYLMRQKYNKMANINCTLPAGLDAYMTKDFSGVSAVLSHNFIAAIKADVMINRSSNAIEDNDDAITHKCSGSDSMTQNEEHCLLEATSLNSLYTNDQTQQQNEFKIDSGESLQNMSSALLENRVSNSRVRHFEIPSESEINADILKANPTNENLSSIDSPYVQATDILNQCQNALTPFMPVNNSYIKPNALNNWQNITHNHFESINPNQDYISADSVDKIFLKDVHSNRNIFNHPTATEAPLHATSILDENTSANMLSNSNSGYTTLEQLNKPQRLIPTIATTLGTHNDTPASETRQAISGYVTQRELTAFGHQQQKHNLG